MSDGMYGSMEFFRGNDGVTRELQVPSRALHARELKSLQRVTEDTVRSQALAEITPFTSILQNGLVKPIADRIADAFEGIRTWPGFERIRSMGQTVQDGQEALNARADLLSPLLDYGSAYMGSVSGFFNAGVAPFTNQIGPLRGVEMTSRGFKLLDKGLWDIRAQITASWVLPTILQPTVRWRVRVSKPSGELYSEQVATLTDNSLLTQTIVSSVVVPEAGYLVQVEVLNITTGRELLGGPAWNRLTVQHISRATAGHTGAEDSQRASNGG